MPSSRSVRAIRAAAHAGSICVIAGHDPLAQEYVDEVMTVRDGRITDRRAPIINSP
jgi:ABC-type lipoprotein export system ATPase subunit